MTRPDVIPEGNALGKMQVEFFSQRAVVLLGALDRAGMRAGVSDNAQHCPAQAHDSVAGKPMADTHAHKTRIRRRLKLVALGGVVGQRVWIESKVEPDAAIGMILKYPALGLLAQAI